jgi:glycosyltransferase involved in cell wall biosynthesis
MVSIVIPARNEKYLNPTIEELLKNARGEIEIIVNLDGYWPDPIIGDPRVRYIHKGEAQGMRAGINSAVAIARGKYIMKIDGHCMVDEGYDVKLVADCEPNWVVIPRRKRLDAENWCIQDVGKPDVDYNYLSFPDNPADFGGPGLNGRIWTQKIVDRRDPKYDIDEELSFQGSCWFMHRDHFYDMELMDDENWGPFWNEAQELGFKTWLSGGKVMRNKKTWYAHLHKGKKEGRGYSMPNSWAVKGATYANEWLYKDKVWHKQIYPLSWLIERFMPMPTWPENWKEKLDEIKRNTAK